MTRRNSNTLTDYPEQPENTDTSPSASRRSTDPNLHERRNSRLGQVMDSIRHALAQEQEKLFGERKAAHHDHQYNPAAGERLAKLRDQDQAQRKRVEEEMLWESEAKDSTSPAVEARQESELNENGMGAESHQGRRDSWGWPGLGTYAEPPKDPAQTRRKSSTKSGSGRVAAMEPKMEAAAFEAIDNAAESETYGWPGLGDLPAPRK
ncbi:uncharacterized protein Z518_02730 [Rhinocladiella mackenziei CBS 650.93]|uniref:Uncharacterized protein n=1 Tax=Rhinocladiella mackenziei CBS 650.93 TaxID=1442369 RepID=A0A0D2JFM4_9EURO|nr:uncharacterized protein Z518_02730 [Rhinocladiella mackenziei CBS 650.93]KIX08075.1 hypothetical protein Z518_02730 [Rhinocladiella mackenziei CBS 650.93]